MTKNKIKKIALKYNTRGKFAECDRKAYDVAYRNKWLDDICGHMINVHEDWSDIQKIYDEAQQYYTLDQFRIGSPKAYSAAYRNEWLIFVSNHFIEIGPGRHRKPVKPKVYNEALKVEAPNPDELVIIEQFGKKVKAFKLKGFIESACKENLNTKPNINVKCITNKPKISESMRLDKVKELYTKSLTSKHKRIITNLNVSKMTRTILDNNPDYTNANVFNYLNDNFIKEVIQGTSMEFNRSAIYGTLNRYKKYGY